MPERGRCASLAQVGALEIIVEPELSTKSFAIIADQSCRSRCISRYECDAKRLSDWSNVHGRMLELRVWFALLHGSIAISQHLAQVGGM